MPGAKQAMAVQPPIPSAFRPAVGDGLRTIYWRQFALRDVVTPEQRKVMHELRYQVYCVENAFEDPARHPGGLEIDRFDSHALHALLIHRPTGVAVGTVRIVLPVPGQLSSSFALQSICSAAELSGLPLATTGEVSRFCIEKAFHHLLHDRHDQPATTEGNATLVGMRRVIPSMALGLIQWLVETSQARGITHWCAVMEPTLLRLLSRLGIHFDRIGELVDYHGWRQPCVIEIDRMLDCVQSERPDVWSIIAQRALDVDHA